MKYTDIVKRDYEIIKAREVSHRLTATEANMLSELARVRAVQYELDEVLATIKYQSQFAELKHTFTFRNIVKITLELEKLGYTVVKAGGYHDEFTVDWSNK